jgi:hypothetical protein
VGTAALWLRPRQVAPEQSHIRCFAEEYTERENCNRERTYHLWGEDGRPKGREQEYWEQAEAMVSQEESEE